MAKRLTIAIGICFFLVLSVVLYISSSSFTRTTSASAGTTGIDSRDNSAHWYLKSKTTRLKGVALVIHGLNLKPDRMHSLIAFLNDAGIDVLNVSLKGHGNNFLWNMKIPIEEARLESFRNVTYDLWLDEVHRAYLKVAQRASEKNVPVLFVGYSLGGLLGCDLVLTHPDVFYDRMMLFAPAFNISAESYLLKALTPFPNVVIDSLSPVSYRANDGTPMAAYKALFEARDHFEHKINDRLNIPAVLFIDEKDEFISCSRLQQMIVSNSLNRWKIHIVRKDADLEEKLSHHLIIDQTAVGEEMWRDMTSIMKRHVSNRN
jgi:alpha-beta hydrolase superfamily lysophospholipase